MAYNDLILESSPKYYFRFDNGGVQNVGSDTTITINVGANTGFPTTGGILNSGKATTANYDNTNYGLQVTQQTTYISDKTFTVSGWFKVGSSGITTGNHHILRTAQNTGEGIILTKSAGNMVLYATIGNRQVGGGAGTSPSLSYDVWHHFAVTCDGSNLKLYLDGNLIDTQTAPSTTPADGTQYWFRYTGSTNRYGVLGEFDEMALFDSALSATTIASHYNYVNGATVSASPSTASSLFVHPTVLTQINISVAADVATASALTPDHRVSNFDNPKTLLTYINSINPYYYIRFKDANLANEISGTTDTWTILGTPTFKQISGVSTEPSVILNNEGNYNNSGDFRPQRESGVNPEFANNFFDDDVSLGFWIKTTDSNVRIFEAYRLDIGNTWQLVDPKNYNLKIKTDGKVELVLGFDDNGTMVYETLTSGEAVNNGAWHFIAFKFNGSTATLYLDGEEETTVSGLSTLGTRPEINVINFGGESNNEWASIVQGPYSLLTGTVVSNIWNIGTANFQAKSFMVDPTVKISTGFYDKVDSYAPILNFKFDGSGTPVSTVNPDYTTLGLASTFNSARVAYGISAKNVNGYRVTDTISNWNGILDTPSGTFTTDNEWSMSALVKVDSTKVGGTGGAYGANRQFAIISGDGFGDIALGYSNTKWLAYAAEEFWATELTLQSTSNIDSNWHLLTATFDGTYFKLYVDGKEEASQDTSTYYANTPYKTVDTGSLYIGGGENFYFQMGSTQDVDKLIDHVGIYDFALSATEAFELWQSVGVDAMLASNATFVLPVGAAGYGPTIHPGVMYSSALLPDPTQFDEIIMLPLPMTAFIDTVTPNFAATSNATITPDPMTASAQAENPGWNVGENNAVLHMNASATFVHPQLLIPGFWFANPMIANPVVMVQPGVVTTQGGLVLAQVMTASGSLVLPPAYKSLFDDKWYDLLYSQHSLRHNFRATNGGNGEAILKLFDDVTTDKAVGSTIKNNLPTTITSDGINVSTAEPDMNIVAEFTPTTNTPLLGIGYFDDYERKAVRFNNITTGYEDSEYINTGFTFELSIKTTKANQIIAFGKTRNFYAYQQYTTSYGLSDGKLFLKSTSAIGPAPTSHFKESLAGNTLIGNKNIADGQWHHIVIQAGWDDNRVQFWIDGELDKQKIGGLRLDGPSFLGFNSQSSTYASDFQTSAWSYDSHAFPREHEIDAHRYAYIKYDPILAQPMFASTKSGDHLAVGNRARALMLYWWPTDSFQNPPLTTKQFNTTGFPDIETWTTELTTADFIKSEPQFYYGWDVYPVDITGYFVSELVKPESYGGSSHIKVGSKPFIGTGQNYNINPEYLYNDQGTFKDPITDAPRYIDLINDIDLRNFDAIFFKNFPDDTKEKESYTTNEDVDTYFGSKESQLYDAFIKSLRSAVDTGISLYITNPQLAIDLGIIDRVETVPDMDELSGIDSDIYSPTVSPGNSPQYSIENAARWYDSQKNNRLRVVNLLPGFTDVPGVIYTDYLFYQHDDSNDFGAPDRPYDRYEYRPNGLSINDEFIIDGNNKAVARNYLAVPFNNVKSGTIITAFANTVKRGITTIANPYKDYATCIVVEPGDVLNGTQCGGKIVVNFTEDINKSLDSGDIDLISDYWINFAYNQGDITEEEKNVLLNSYSNIDRKLEDNIITQQEYDKLAYWSSNGDYIISNAYSLDDPTTKVYKKGFGKGQRTSYVNKIRKDGTLYTDKVVTDSIWFTFKYAWRYRRTNLIVASIFTRGFWWLSNRESYDGIVQRPLAVTASATLPMPTVTGQKDRSVNASVMIASGTIIQPVGTSASAINIAPLPFQAIALMNNYVTRYTATPMRASAVLRTNNRIFTTAVDEVVLYVMHTDPILYIREDVIK